MLRSLSVTKPNNSIPSLLMVQHEGQSKCIHALFMTSSIIELSRGPAGDEPASTSKHPRPPLAPFISHPNHIDGFILLQLSLPLRFPKIRLYRVDDRHCHFSTRE